MFVVAYRHRAPDTARHVKNGRVCSGKFRRNPALPTEPRFTLTGESLAFAGLSPNRGDRTRTCTPGFGGACFSRSQAGCGTVRASLGVSRDGRTSTYSLEVAGKRHHYLSQFLLRRFAEKAGKREGLVWRLDKKSGQSRPVAPKYEAALPHYYRLEHEDGTTDSGPEDLIARIEAATAAALQRIERGELPSDEDRAWLALFVVLQHRRTPVAREWQRFRDELMSTMMAEVTLGTRRRFTIVRKWPSPP